MIKYINTTTSRDYCNDIQKVLLDGIRDSMVLFVQFWNIYIGHCVGIRLYDFFVIKKVSYNLKQENPLAIYVLDNVYSKIQWNQIWNLEVMIFFCFIFLKIYSQIEQLSSHSEKQGISRTFKGNFNKKF